MPLDERPPRDLRAHRQQTERWLLFGFILLLLVVGGGLIFWNYGWGGVLGGLACILGPLALGSLLWLLLVWLGRWAEGDG
ncbi:MAG: hypothetical protein JXA37_14390 [Chloroflexia bacterium]|nr:hypothetical protein [Chloroflexia bacterium]